MAVTMFKVQGMTCGHCVSTVKAAVSSVPGAQDVEVDLAMGTVTVSGTASEQAVAQAISTAGYDVVVPNSELVGATSLPLAGGGCGCGCG
ncbi:heavy-metal-associated domain-containing protein [Mycolicibacterium gilvum]|uniref:Metal-binding protein n=1 Tax=Mycolicibacterium gilvum TaxID=1804 RepID=A0A378SQH0_9MYCO|nr:heavy metal-associated domain-containing protein [Mycolicibacterium gilvum]MCV7055640.1 heavy-metal-associated domain-containing protein [Mycolicibacterium gilvum]STZ44348.1 Putative metal-binding protein [Mycolicibacterium gilvum]